MKILLQLDFKCFGKIVESDKVSLVKEVILMKQEFSDPNDGR